VYKDKDRQKEANRESAKRYRQKGMTAQKQGVTSYPDIIDKLTDSVWRVKLEKICQSFKSRNPQDMEICWLGDTSLVIVCDWLECTA